MREIRVSSTSGGGHEIWTTFAGQKVLLVVVRPVGTLSMGELRDAFSEGWVPHLVEALQLAHRIASREKPWEPWCDVSAGGTCETAGGS
jgi:hypothetical protein